jgi:hypothetical protein
MRDVIGRDCADLHEEGVCPASEAWDYARGTGPIESKLALNLSSQCFHCLSLKLGAELADRNLDDCYVYVSTFDTKVPTYNKTFNDLDGALRLSLVPEQFDCLLVDVAAQLAFTSGGPPLTCLWSSNGLAWLEDRLGGTHLDQYKQFLFGDALNGQARPVTAQADRLLGIAVENFTLLGVNAYAVVKNMVLKGQYIAFERLNVLPNLLALKPARSYVAEVQRIQQDLQRCSNTLARHTRHIGEGPLGVRLEVTVPYDHLHQAREYLLGLMEEARDRPGLVHCLDARQLQAYVELTARSFILPIERNLELLAVTRPSPETAPVIQEALFTIVVFVHLVSETFWTGNTKGHAQSFVFNQPSVESPFCLDGRRVTSRMNMLVFCWAGPNGELVGPFDPVQLRFRAGWAGDLAFRTMFDKFVKSSALAKTPREAQEAHLTMQADTLLTQAGNDLILLAGIVLMAYARTVSDLLGQRSFDLPRLQSVIQLTRAQLEELDQPIQFAGSESPIGFHLEQVLYGGEGVTRRLAMSAIAQRFRQTIDRLRRDDPGIPSALSLLAMAFVSLDWDVVHVPGGRSFFTDPVAFSHLVNRELVQAGAGGYVPPTAEETAAVQADDDAIRGVRNLAWTVPERAALILAKRLPSCAMGPGRVDWTKVKTLTPIFTGRRTKQALTDGIKNLNRHHPDTVAQYDEVLDRFNVAAFDQLPGLDPRITTVGDLVGFLEAHQRPEPAAPQQDLGRLRDRLARFFGLEQQPGPPAAALPHQAPQPAPVPVPPHPLQQAQVGDWDWDFPAAQGTIMCMNRSLTFIRGADVT